MRFGDDLEDVLTALIDEAGSDIAEAQERVDALIDQNELSERPELVRALSRREHRDMTMTLERYVYVCDVALALCLKHRGERAAQSRCRSDIGAECTQDEDEGQASAP